jgi:predicted permease
MRLLHRLYYLARLRRIEMEVAEEIEFHRARKQQELEERGLSSAQASAAARRDMGNATIAREGVRAIWLFPWVESVFQDLTYAARNLRAHPGFTLVAIGALAAGIGLNTSLFTVFRAAALKPWAVPDPGRVVNVYALPVHIPKGAHGGIGFSITEARFLNAESRTFAGIIAMRQSAVHFGQDTAGPASNALIVTGNYFRVLGVAMERGRGFIAQEDRVDAPEAVAVLSYVAWQNHFGGDPEIIGKQIRLDDVPFTVVGVASRDFEGTVSLRTGVWIPLAALPVLRPLDTSVPDFLKKPDYCCSAVAGRLRAGVSQQQARAELELLSRRFAALYSVERNFLGPKAILLTGTAQFSHQEAKSTVTTGFILMFVGVILVLLLVCANVSNLLLARAAARQVEIATRLSLGASRARVIRQLLTESLVLAAAACAISIAIANVLPPYVLGHMIHDPLNIRLQPDSLVLCFSIALSMLACVSFGLVPAMQASSVNIAVAMKEQAFGSRLTLRNVLLATQVAFSAMLLVSASLVVRGIQHAHTLDPGFPVERIAVVSFDLPANSYTRSRIQTLVSELNHALGERRNSKTYGLARTAPFANGHWFTSFRLPGEDEDHQKLIEDQEVTRGYFGVLGIPIVTGRNFEPSDTTRRAILINQAMARRYFPAGTAVGKTIIIGKEAREIVGVVKNAYTTGLDSIEPLMYEPVSGKEMPQLLIRDSIPAFIQRVEATARHLDPRIQIRAEPLTTQLSRYLAPARAGAALASALGFLALALASVGMFGVFAYIVRQRTREIGIRMALGAKPIQILALVFDASSRSVFIGLIIGLVLSAATSRLMHKFLFGLSGLDPVPYASVCLILCMAALAATWVPAHRAIHVNPVRALHYE